MYVGSLYVAAVLCISMIQMTTIIALTALLRLCALFIESTISFWKRSEACMSAHFLPTHLCWVQRDIQQKAKQLDSKQQASAAVIRADNIDDMVLQDVARADLAQHWQSVRKEA